MPHLPAATDTMTVNGKRIASNMRTELREAIHGGNIADCIMERNNWSTSTFNNAAWDEFEMAMKRLRNESKTRLIKYVHDWLPVGCQQQHMHKAHNPTCPTCKAPDPQEKTDHMFRCPKRKSLRDICLTKLQTTLTKIETNNLILVSLTLRQCRLQF